jgi:hypothetical protein
MAGRTSGMQEVKDHFSRSQHAFDLGKREVFTFRADLGKQEPGGGLTTG